MMAAFTTNVADLAPIRITTTDGCIALSVRGLAPSRVAVRTAEDWDESKHPRHPAGSSDGGKFAPATGPESGLTPEADAAFWSNTQEHDDLAQVDDSKMKPTSYAAGFVRLYHVTDIDAAKSISVQGFSSTAPNKFQGFESAIDGTYGWACLERAKLEIQRMEEISPGAKSGLAIVEFQVPRAAWGRLRPDEDQGEDSTWQQSYKSGLSAAVKGDVPPDWIRGFHVDRTARAAARNLAEWSEADHPRHPAGSPDGGKFAPSSGGWPTLRMAPGMDPLSDDAQHMERTARRCAEVAREFGVDPSVIHIVHKPPTTFMVGSREFREGGHFDPSTGEIEINAAVLDRDMMGPTQGLAAHEISHLIYHESLREQRSEHVAISNMPEAEWRRMFRMDGYLREDDPAIVAEFAERFPVSYAFAQTWGDSYVSESAFSKVDPTDPAGRRTSRQRMIDEDGHSDYAHAYWEKDAVQFPGGLERALNETLAEVTRYLTRPTSWHEPHHGHPYPGSPWAKLAIDLRNAWNKVRSRKSGTSGTTVTTDATGTGGTTSSAGGTT